MRKTKKGPKETQLPLKKKNKVKGRKHPNNDH